MDNNIIELADYRKKFIKQKNITWQPIETAPRDGTKFIALIGTAVYGAYYDDGRFCWIMHSNKASGRVYQKKQLMELNIRKKLSQKERQIINLRPKYGSQVLKISLLIGYLCQNLIR